MRKIILLFVSLLVLPICSAGQTTKYWQKLGVDTLKHGFHRSSYFLNPQVGFTYVSGMNISWPDTMKPFGPAYVYRTTDGGSTWTYLPFFDTLGSSTKVVSLIGCSIRQLYFVTMAHGFLASSRGIYETTDTGAHWQLLVPGMFVNVYATDSSIYGIKNDHIWQGATPHWYDPGLLIFSHDHGRSWDTLQRANPLSVSRPPRANNPQAFGLSSLGGNRDGFVVAVFSDSSSSREDTSKHYWMVYTTDDGGRWQSQRIESTMPFCDFDYLTGLPGYFIQLQCIPHSTQVFGVVYPDSLTEEDKYSFQQWTPGDSAHETYFYESGLWPAGAGCLQYVVNARSSGFLRSTDEGATWTLVSGILADEIDDQDFPALSVVGYGATVYSSACPYDPDSTQLAKLWRTTTGGDGTLSADALAPRLAFDPLTSSGTRDTIFATCDSGALQIVYRNLRCAYTKFHSLTVSGLAAEQYSFVPTRHVVSIGIPDTTQLMLKGLVAGTHDYTIHMHFVDDEFAATDTDFHFTAVVRNGAASVLGYAKSIQLSGYSGDTVNVPYCMIASGGDTLTISGPSFSTLRFTLNTDLLTPVEFESVIAGLAASNLNVGTGYATVDLNISNALPLNAETVVGFLRCVVRVADTTRTAVQGRGSLLTSTDTRCILLGTLEQGADVDLLGVCGTATVLNFMKSGTLPTDIIEVHPNPATSEVTIAFRNDLHSPIYYSLTNSLGMQYRGGIVSGNELTLPVDQLPAGVYYLRATGAMGGLAATRRLIVVH